MYIANSRATTKKKFQKKYDLYAERSKNVKQAMAFELLPENFRKPLKDFKKSDEMRCVV